MLLNPDASDIKIGGVAASAQGELASEEDAIVVELFGSYDMANLIFQLEQRIDDNQSLIHYYKQKENPSKHDLQSISEREQSIDYYKKHLDILKTKDIKDLTNLAHFTHQELREIGYRKGDSLTGEEALRNLAAGQKLISSLENPEDYIHLVNGKIVDMDGKPVAISDFSRFFLKV